MEISSDGRVMSRDSDFSYECRICCRCCHGKGIQVNPYETMRLAECLGISTSDFREKYLINQFLRHKDNSDACVFLDITGCMVHRDRPLVCRLYPLGRARLENGEEIFFKVNPHPESEGVYGQASTVDQFLLSQDVEPFIRAEKEYLELIKKLAGAALDLKETENLSNTSSPAEFDDSRWILDPDPVLNRYCEFKGIRFPATSRDKLEIHLQALFAWVEGEWDPLS